MRAEGRDLSVKLETNRQCGQQLLGVGGERDGSRRRRATGWVLAGVLAAASGVGLATAAAAVPLGGEETTTSISPMAAYSQWNVVSFGDMAVQVESDGAVAVGGELTFTRTNVGMKSSAVVPGVGGTVGVLAQDLKLAAPSSGTLEVHAGGLVVGNGGDVDLLDRDSNGASVALRVVAKGSGYDSAPSVILRNGEKAAVNAELFSELFSQAAATATSQKVSAAASCNPQAAVSISGSTATVRPVEGTTSVWTLSATQLNALKEIKFEGATISGGTGTNVVVNVTGDEDVSLGFNMPGVGESNAGGILWNFPASTRITQVGDSTYGSILAPQAQFVKNSANINGTLVAAGGTLSGSEQHHHPFTGTLLSCDTITPQEEPSQAPTPVVSEEPSESPTPVVSEEPSESSAPEATDEPSESPSPEATDEPSDSPSPEVTDEPSDSPSPEVTDEPSESPSPSVSDPSTTPVVPTSGSGTSTPTSGTTATSTPVSGDTAESTTAESTTAATTGQVLAQTGSDAAGLFAAVLALSVGGAAVLSVQRGRRK